MTDEEIGAELRAMRKEAGLNQTELAGLVGLPQGSISRYENGITVCSAAVYREWARVCGRHVMTMPADEVRERRIALIADAAAHLPEPWLSHLEAIAGNITAVPEHMVSAFGVYLDSAARQKGEETA